MAKHLNISLGVTADTSKAKAQLQDLQNQLTKIINSPTSNKFTLTKDLKEASAAATELQAHLQRATNMETGTLDFTKLNQSLSSGKKSLADYGHALLQIGPDGEKAFLQLTKSVAQSEIPFRRVNKHLNEMWISLKNTARWQLSSSVLHGFMGAVSSAYGYAQDLNESLTNIRIVTGQNTDQMAKFAKEANAAAKALSTTTTRYTNASLIYYQQGLSDEEVKKRTDITVKMANAAGQSAETVSDQLTAVWNNFYDGTKSLEHYADVMTALGAATASSTDEIAGGLEKFAAVAETIGLSYEYAASALATITSNTRQSEEVVGTALKTIFARIQGLNLGETLEDGTSLNKYSAALESVGISIFDTTGELKKMDNILNELGNKWQTLGKDQQVALAQTVAGVRQYNQLVSLMDNWNNGDNDSFQANLNTANTSEGALQEQADIYAEGWEAASDRVRASWEGIYDTIVDDDVFITMLDGLAEVIQFVDRLIDGIGGLGGVMSSLGAIGTAVFSKQIASGLSNAAYSIKMMMPGAYEAQERQRQNTVVELADTYANHDFIDSGQREAVKQVYQDMLKTQIAIGEKGANLNELEQFKLNILKEQQQVLADQYIEAQRQYSDSKEQKNDSAARLGVFDKKGKKGGVVDSTAFTSTIDATATIKEALSDVSTAGILSTESIKKIETALEGLDGEASEVEDLANAFRALQKGGENGAAGISKVKAAVEKVEKTAKEKFVGQVRDGQSKDAKKEAENYIEQSHRMEQANNDASKYQQNLNNNSKGINDTLNEGHENTIKWSEGITAAASSVMALTSALQAYKGILEVANDDTLTFGEKATAIASSLASTALNLAFTIGSLGKTFGGTAGVIKGFNAATAFLNPSLAATGAASGAAATGVAGLASAFGSLMIAAAPWLAIAALVVGSIIAIDGAFVSEKEAADEAAESAKHLAEEYDKINESYQNLKNTLSNYQEAKDGIAELTKGTQEYKEAVLAANEQALDLLENNKNLAYTIDADGLINIDDEALEKLQQEKLNGLTNAQSMKILAQQKSSEANIDLERSKLKSGAQKETTFNVLTKEYNSGNTAMFASDEIFETELLKIFENMRPGDDALEAMVKEREAIEKLIQELNKNTAIQESNNKLIAQNFFGDKLANSDLSSQQQDLASTVLASNIDNYTNDLFEEYKKGEIETDKLLSYAKEYGKTYGLDFESVYRDGNGNPEKVKYTYTDQFGESQEKFVNYDIVAQFAALQEALNLSADDFLKITETIEEGTKNLTDTQTKALSTFANGEIGDLSELTAKEIETIGNAIGLTINTETGEVKGEINNLGKVLEITPETFKTANNNLNDAIENFKNNLTTSVREKFETINTNGMSLAVQKRIGDVLNKAFHEGGYESLDAATKIFSQLRGNVDEFFTVVDSMDWTTGTVTAEEFNQKLRDANIILPNASSALQDFIHWINEVKGAASSASNVDYYKTMNEIQTAGFKLDGSLSDEQYNVLLNHSDAKYQELAKLFTFQPDGTWAFSGDSADIKNANDIFLKDYQSHFMAGAEEATDRIQLIESKYQNYDFEKLTNGKPGDSDLLKDRVEALDLFAYDSMSEEDKKDFDEYKAAINSGNYDRINDEKGIARLTKKYSSNFDNESLEAAKSSESLELSKNVQAMFATAQDKEALDELYETYKNVEGAAEAYNQATRRIENTRLAEELGVTQEELDEVAEGYYETAKAQGYSEEAATKAAYNEAESHFKRSHAIEELSSKWKEYANTINDIGTPDENVGDNTQRLNDLKQALEDLTGVDADLFTDKWLKDNKAKLKKLAEGSEETVKDIKKEFSEIESLEFFCEAGIEVNYDNLEEEEQAIHNALMAIEDANILTLHADLDNKQYLAKLNESFQMAGWTSGEIQKYMEAMGFNVEMTVTRKKLTGMSPAMQDAFLDAYIGPENDSAAAEERANAVAQGWIDVPSVKVVTQNGAFGGNYSSNTVEEAADSVSGSGSSDEPTKMEYTKEIDFYERYKEWDDTLDDIDDVLSDVKKKEDALYGQNKISAMKNRNKLLLQEVEALQKKKKEAEAYFEIDKQNLQNAAGALGYNIDFGSRDQILNYTSTMQSLFDELHAMEVHYNSLGSGKAQQQYKKDVLDPFNQKIDDLKAYIDQYDETRELLEDIENEIDDSLYEWKNLNYDILHYELEIKLELNDVALTRLDYYLKKYEDDFYSVSEAAGVMFNKLGPILSNLRAYDEFYTDTTKIWDSTAQQYVDIMNGVTEATHKANEERLEAMSGGLLDITGGVVDLTNNNGELLEDYLASNKTNTNNVEDYYKQATNGIPIEVGEEGYINSLDRDITQADYAEGLNEVIAGLWEELGSLEEVQRWFKEYYKQAWELGQEELKHYTGSLEHLTNSLKHYNKVAEITGKANDTAFNKKILNAQADMIENQLSVAASNYELAKNQQQYYESLLATAEVGTEEWETYTQWVKDATKATEEAQEEMLSKTEEWAESLRAILEHELSDAARILENALTGGTSFDAMSKALERAESLQEEYLTDTNKIYETEKLMRQTRQEIDKTTNNAAKLRLNMFITETEQLQQQNRLSEYELSIQQAKYQLLLAELALEEAKNAKSTVRLQRDFEGNFGYVYTADQDQIDNALQNLDDKRNELYNIGLEGANNYTSKYLSTLQAMYDEFTSIQENYLNGMYESEKEYQDVMTDAYDYYFTKLKEYEKLYGIAIRTDSRITADAWSTDFQDMIYNTEVWANECDIYISQVTELFEEWGETSEDLNQILDDTTGSIDEIVRASNELADIIHDNVIPGLQKEIELLNKALKLYADWANRIEKDQNYYEGQGEEAEEDLNTEAGRKDQKETKPTIEEPTPAQPSNPPAPPSNNDDKENPSTGGGDRYNYIGYKEIKNSDGSITTQRVSGTVNIPGSYDDPEDYFREQGITTTNKSIVKYSTGGYTGAWGPEGKLAVLHEKEIVLNKSDTENILEAVDMVRQISSGIDQQASYQRIATLITQTLQDKKDNDVLEQHVTIEARFDNVRDRYEIEAAFDNLINKASQYANRNKI